MECPVVVREIYWLAGSRELNPSLGGQAGVVVVSCWFFPEQALFSTKIAMVVGARVTTYLARGARNVSGRQ